MHHLIRVSFLFAGLMLFGCQRNSIDRPSQTTTTSSAVATPAREQLNFVDGSALIIERTPTGDLDLTETSITTTTSAPSTPPPSHHNPALGIEGNYQYQTTSSFRAASGQ